MYVHASVLTELIRQHHQELRDEAPNWTRRMKLRRRAGRETAE